MRLALAYNSQLVRNGIAELLRQFDFIISCEVSCRELKNNSESKIDADVLLLNLDDFVSCEPSETVGKIRASSPKVKIVLIGGAQSDYDMVQRCLRSGAHGFITDEAPPEALEQYIRLAQMGLTAVSNVGGSPAPAHRPTESEPQHELSGRERHVLSLIAKGSPNKVIANSLDISESTVKAHLKSILRKIGVRNRTQAAIWAFNNGVGRGGDASGGQQRSPGV